MRSTWFIVIGLSLLLGSGLAWWLGREEVIGTGLDDSTPERVEVESAPRTDGETPVPEGNPGPEAEDSAARSHARRVVHVPDNREPAEAEPPTTDERDITADNFEQLTQANLDHALTGDMASGYFVTRARMTCERFADSPEALERAIRRVDRRVKNALANGRSLPARPDFFHPWSYTGDMQANRAHMTDWYHACQSVMGMFGPDLRQRLESMALSGNVMARYLYATWPENVLDAGQAFDAQFRWERLAREFSQANMESGEVAGLMAFGQSYLSGWFTARNGDLALAFGVAALNCGFETISMRSYLASSIERLTSSENPADQQRLQFVLDEADQLGRFCAY